MLIIGKFSSIIIKIHDVYTTAAPTRYLAT